MKPLKHSPWQCTFHFHAENSHILRSHNTTTAPSVFFQNFLLNVFWGWCYGFVSEILSNVKFWWLANSIKHNFPLSVSYSVSDFFLLTRLIPKPTPEPARVSFIVLIAKIKPVLVERFNDYRTCVHMYLCILRIGKRVFRQQIHVVSLRVIGWKITLTSILNRSCLKSYVFRIRNFRWSIIPEVDFYFKTNISRLRRCTWAMSKSFESFKLDRFPISFASCHTITFTC